MSGSAIRPFTSSGVTLPPKRTRSTPATAWPRYSAIRGRMNAYFCLTLKRGSA